MQVPLQLLVLVPPAVAAVPLLARAIVKVRGLPMRATAAPTAAMVGRIPFVVWRGEERRVYRPRVAVSSSHPKAVTAEAQGRGRRRARLKHGGARIERGL